MLVNNHGIGGKQSIQEKKKLTALAKAKDDTFASLQSNLKSTLKKKKKEQALFQVVLIAAVAISVAAFTSLPLISHVCGFA